MHCNHPVRDNGPCLTVTTVSARPGVGLRQSADVSTQVKQSYHSQSWYKGKPCRYVSSKLRSHRAPFACNMGLPSTKLGETRRPRSHLVSANEMARFPHFTFRNPAAGRACHCRNTIHSAVLGSAQLRDSMHAMTKGIVGALLVLFVASASAQCALDACDHDCGGFTPHA